MTRHRPVLQAGLDDLEEQIWGSGRWEIAIAGTAPAPGTYNTVVFDPDLPNALLFSAESWEEWQGTGGIQGISSDSTTLIEAFVATCDGDHCEECVGGECDLVHPVGEVCRLEFTPEPFSDGTVLVTFNGTSCSITVETG